MNATEHNLLVEAPNLAVMQMQTPTQIAVSQTPKLGALASLRLHWPEYLMEASLLGAFMVSACVFGVLYGFPQSPVRQAISSDFLRGLLGGLSMGLTAIAIFYSPWGKQSGAHINPSVTLTFLRLGKIKFWDALFYIASQFVGAVLGVVLVAQFLRQESFSSGCSIRSHDTGTARAVGGVRSRIHYCDGNDVGSALFLESPSACSSTPVFSPAAGCDLYHF